MYYSRLRHDRQTDTQTDRYTDTHTHRRTDRQTSIRADHGMHRIMWCDCRSIHSIAERTLSASLSAPLGLAWLAHRPTARSARSSHPIARLLACLCLLMLACLCLLAHRWLPYGSIDRLLEDLPMLIRNSLPRGWKWLVWALWDRRMHA